MADNKDIKGKFFAGITAANENKDENITNEPVDTGTTNPKDDIKTRLLEGLNSVSKKKESTAGGSLSNSVAPTESGESPSGTQSINGPIDITKVKNDILTEYYSELGIEPLHTINDKVNKLIESGVDPVEAVESMGLEYDIDESGEQPVLNARFSPEQMEVAKNAQKYVQEKLPERVENSVYEQMKTLNETYLAGPKDEAALEEYQKNLAELFKVKAQVSGTLLSEEDDDELLNRLDVLKSYVSAWDESPSNRYRVSFMGPAGVTFQERKYTSPYQKDLNALTRQASSPRLREKLTKEWGDLDEALDNLEYDHDLYVMSSSTIREASELVDKVGKGFSGELVAKGFSDYFTKFPETIEKLKARDSFKKLNQKLVDISSGEKSVNDLTDNEFMFINSMLTAQETLKRYGDKVPVAAQAAEAIGGSLGFMLEMALTAGIGSSYGSAAKQSILRLSAGRLTPTVTNKIAAQATEAIVHRAVQTAAMPSFVLGVANRYADGEDMGHAIVNGYFDTYTEVLSESLFTTPLNKLGTSSAMRQFWNRTASSFGKVKNIQSFIKAFGEEYTEEIFSGTVSAWREGENITDLSKVGEFMADKRQQATIGLSIGVMTAVGGGANMVHEMGMRRKFKYLGESLGTLREDIDELLANGDFTLVDLVENVENVVMDYSQTHDVDPAATMENYKKALMYAQKFLQINDPTILQKKGKEGQEKQEEPAKAETPKKPLDVVKEQIKTKKEEVQQKENVPVEGEKPRGEEQSDTQIVDSEDKRGEEVTGQSSALDFAPEDENLVNRFMEGTGLTSEELTKLEGVLTSAKEKAADKDEVEFIDELLSDVKAIKDDMVSAEDIKKKINARPKTIIDNSRSAIEPVEGAKQRVHVVAIGENVAGSIQETEKGGKKTYQAFSANDNKLGDFNTPEEAMNTLRENLGNELGGIEGVNELKSGKTQKFFSNVVNGADNNFKPNKKWEPLIKLNKDEEEVRKEYDRHNGNFDEHIATSIPAFRDVQIKVLNALKTVFKGAQGLMYDIGGSEGGFAKTFTSLTGMRSINLEVNEDMANAHNSTPVEGSEVVSESFGAGFTMNGRFIPRHVPKEKADVVHESMTFQFIGDKREGMVKEVVDKYLKADGLFITEEKLNPNSEAQWEANEEKKNEYKKKYYTEDQLKIKDEEVLTGMRKNQVSAKEYKKILEDHFDYVEEYWDGGNFKGFVASNDAAKVQAFLHAVGDTTTEYSEKNIKPKRRKSPPSPDKLFGKKAKFVNINEMTALRDKIRAEARAARESVNAYKKSLKTLAEEVNNYVKRGRITAKQAGAIITRMAKTNIYNPVSREKFLRYADKIFTNADNIQLLKEANSVRSRVRKAARRKNKDADARNVAQAFAQIDPRLVEDVQGYIDMGGKLIGTLGSTRMSKGELTPKYIANLKEIAVDVDAELERQKSIKDAERAEIMKELAGKEMPSPEELENMAKAEAEKLTANIEDFFKSAANHVKSIIDNGVDPATGESVDLTPTQKKVLSDFVNMDLSVMSPRAAVDAADVLRNFIINGTTNGMEAIVEYNKGAKSVRDASKTHRGYKFLSPLMPNWMARHIASAPLLFENIFRGRTNAKNIMDSMGFSQWIKGKSIADRKANLINNEYYETFSKRKAHGEDFHTRRNIIERGMYAYAARRSPSRFEDAQEEYNIRRQRIKDSIDRLAHGDKYQRKLAEVYQEVYDRLFDGDADFKTMESRVDKNNREAVEWWRAQWNKILPELDEVSRNVYNKIIDPDEYYIPDNYRKVDADDKPISLDESLQASSFDMALQRIYDKESTVLMSKRKFTELPKDKYVSLDFDRNMHATMAAALLDIHTAAATRRMEGFINSPHFNDLFSNGETRSIVKARINGAINSARNRLDYGDKQTAAIERALSHLAQYAATRALGSMTMSIKQVVPVMFNTLINAKGLNFEALRNKDIKKLIDESGYAIANRGVEQMGDVVPIEKGETPKGIVTKLEKASNMWIDNFLVKPDVAIARASWWTYYLYSLKKQGIDAGKIDWSTHKLNEKAASYAQDMVDRQQNVSDADLMGEFLRSRNPMQALVRKMLFPFANFMLNQKIRMYTDMTVLASKSSSMEDKLLATRSLGGLVVEQVAFHALSVGIRLMMFEVAAKLVGYREPEGSFEERLDRYASQGLSYLISDILSPLPIIDDLFIETTRNLLSTFGDNLPDWAELPARNYVRVTSNWGVYGVGIETVNDLFHYADMATGYKYRTDYMGKKIVRGLRASDREVAKGMLAAHVLFMSGVLPAETSGILRRMEQMMNSVSVTEAKDRQYKEKAYFRSDDREGAQNPGDKRSFRDEFEYDTRSRVPGTEKRPPVSRRSRDQR